MKKLSLLILLCLMVIAECAAQKIKVACVGNSITYGSGVANREVNAYPVKLQGMLGDKYEVGNFGKPGATLLNKGHRPYTQQQEFPAQTSLFFHSAFLRTIRISDDYHFYLALLSHTQMIQQQLF